MRAKTLNEILNDASVADLSKASLGSSQYNQKVNQYLKDGFSFIGLKKDKKNDCDKLLSFSRVKNFKYEGILVDSHSADGDSYGRVDSNFEKNDPSYEKDGEFFGLKYDSPNEGYYSESINFFSREFSDLTWFERMGINTMPIPKHIYVKAKAGTKNSYKVPGTVYVGIGDPVVYINENEIVSNLPVYVMGKSSDWHLEGQHQPNTSFNISYTCPTCVLPNPENYNEAERLSMQSGWAHEFYSANNDIQVTGSIYDDPSENLNIDDFVKFSQSYKNQFMETGYHEGSYLTGYQSEGYQEGYSHSGYDYFNRSEYNKFN